MYLMLNARKPPKLNQEFENIRLQASARIRKSVGSEGFKRMRFRYRLLWKLRNMRFQKYPDSCDRGLSHHWVTQTCIVFVFVLLVFILFVFYFFMGVLSLKHPLPAPSINFTAVFESRHYMEQFSAFFEQNRSRRKHASELWTASTKESDINLDLGKPLKLRPVNVFFLFFQRFFVTL